MQYDDEAKSYIHELQDENDKLKAENASLKKTLGVDSALLEMLRGDYAELKSENELLWSALIGCRYVIRQAFSDTQDQYYLNQLKNIEATLKKEQGE